MEGKYYIKVKINYICYSTMSRESLFIIKKYDVAQNNLRVAMMDIIDYFYSLKDDCDICNIEVVNNALFD